MVENIISKTCFTAQPVPSLHAVVKQLPILVQHQVVSISVQLPLLKGQGGGIVLVDLMYGIPQAFPPRGCPQRLSQHHVRLDSNSKISREVLLIHRVTRTKLSDAGCTWFLSSKAHGDRTRQGARVNSLSPEWL
eukprot:s1680_g1.t1